jgi:hypothetical protein
MGNRADCLIMPKAWDQTAIDDLEDTPFSSGTGIRCLIK